MTITEGDSGVCLAELIAALSLGVDLGLGQPMEHVLRECMLALGLGERFALEAWVGCHADSYEQAKWFGDDISARADVYRSDLVGMNRARFAMRNVGAGDPPAQRARTAVEFLVSGRAAMETMHRHATVNPNQALWEKGDFTQIAASMRESGEALVNQLGISEGVEVLDLGCGDGTTALPAARLGANVLGLDIAGNLVEAGNARARSLGISTCKFQEGDASDLHDLEDDRFDLVISIFGAIFAPRPFDVAKEMVRVTRPAGRIIMGNWIANDPTFVAQLLKISATYLPPPPEGFISPVTWGIEENVIERFVGAGVAKDQISCERATYTFKFPNRPEEFLALFRSYYAPTMNAYEAAAARGRENELHNELQVLFNEHNTNRDEAPTLIPATYLRLALTT